MERELAPRRPNIRERVAIARSRVHDDDIAFLLGIAVGLVVLILSGVVVRSDEVIRLNDFAGFWAGARALIDGVNPYDPAQWSAEIARLGVQNPDTLVFGYPGWVALALLPLGLLPLEWASALWTSAGLVAAVVAVRALLRSYAPGIPVVHALVAVGLLGSRSAEATLFWGQWTFLTLAALAMCLVWLRAGLQRRAGLAALAMLAKPHLFIVSAITILLYAAARASWRSIAVAFVGAVAIAFASLIFLPNWLEAWVRYVAQLRLGGTPGVPPATLAAGFASLFGGSGLRPAVVVLGLGVIALLTLDPRSDGWVAAGLALSSVAAPYTRSYDHLLLVVPLVVAAGTVARTSARRAILLAAVGTVLLVVVEPLLAQVTAARLTESLTAFVPLALFLLIFAFVWPTCRIRPRSPAAELRVWRPVAPA